MRGDRLRRLLHVASATVLLTVPIDSWNALRWCLIAAAVLGLVVDGMRIFSRRIAGRLHRAIPVFRESERNRLSGATWLAIGYLAAAFVPVPAPAAGILVGATADPAASLIGSWNREPGRKTLRGSFAALVVSALALSVLAFPLQTVVVGSVVATLLERWSYPFNDNLVVPPSVALVAWILA